MKETYTITLLCVFCNAPLEDEEGKEYHSGDLIKCQQCGEENDYDSVLEIAKEKGMAEIEEDVTKELMKALKGLGK